MIDSTKLQGRKDMSTEEAIAIATAMLDSEFDGIQVLAEFAKLPKGTFVIDFVAGEAGMNKDKTAVTVGTRAELREVVELAQFPNMPIADLPPEAVPAVGSLVSWSFMGTLGLQKFAGMFAGIAATVGAVNTRALLELMSAGQVTNVMIVTGLRTSPDKVELGPDGVTMVPVTYSELKSVTLI